MKRKSGQIEKVKNFLFQMGALPRYGGDLKLVYRSSNDKLAYRKFRKIKRMAFERRPEFKQDGAYKAIYEAFNLRRFDRYGLYWEDLRKCFPTTRWDNVNNKTIYDPSDFKRSECRKWSLNGPVQPKNEESNAASG